MTKPSIKILYAQVTGAAISLKQEIAAGEWSAAQQIADEMRSRLQQLEHQLWLKQKQENAGV